ncbi:hypothetical protein [Chryseobacterium sp. SIMBA_029]|uniref:hypothetical protein n=1 Tax=Chryseobacterium sp. SIMBA_029 TaxID=3085772 RepID=UPI00397D34F9
MIKNVNIIKSKFKRIKKDFFKTELYENLDKNVQEQIKDKILFINNEIPILGYFVSANSYWLLTDMRLITDSFIIYLDDIKIIKIPEVFDEGKSNSECESLEIVKKNSDINTLKLEKSTWYVIFNILNFIIRHLSLKSSQGYSLIFEIEGNHNYYVSEKAILVHNDCGISAIIDAMPS